MNAAQQQLLKALAAKMQRVKGSRRKVEMATAKAVRRRPAPPLTEIDGESAS